MIGLDVAGIDFICPDIASPVRETGGAICRGQRRARVPDAHPPDGRRAAVHRQAGRRPALPAGRAVAGADRRGHRHQRQDDDVADDRPHHQGPRPQGRDDVDRRHRHRRAPRHQGRRLRAEARPGWCCRTRASTSRSWRSPAAASCARASGYDRNDVAVVTNVAPDHLGTAAASTPSSSSPTSRPSSSRRSRATGSRCSTPTTRWSAGCGGAARATSSGSRLEEPGSDSARLHRRPLPPRWPGRRARPHRARRHDRHPARPPRRCSSPGPTCCRRPSAARPCSTSPTRWRRPARPSPAGAALHEIRQGLRTFTTSYYLSPGRMNLINVHNVDVIRRLLPQRGRHARARRLRRALRRA